VVLTTYQILVIEAPKTIAENNQENIDRSYQSYLNLQKTPKNRINLKISPLFEILWYRVVLDEVQNIKNSKTYAFHAACDLKAINRWCLTGTPIQNTIDELYSYFVFIRF
jgi:SNF2 family DNA or RNA helicase